MVGGIRGISETFRLVLYLKVDFEWPAYLRATFYRVPGIFDQCICMHVNTYMMTRKKPKASSEGVKDASVDAGTSAVACDSSSKSKPCSKRAEDSPIHPSPTLVICRNKYMTLVPIRGRTPWIGLAPSFSTDSFPGTGGTSHHIMAHG